MWLGRAWFVDPVDNLNPAYSPRGNGEPGGLPKSALTALNNTVLRLVEASGFQGPGSNPNTTGGTYKVVRLRLPDSFPRVCFSPHVLF
jgi:hypothetical protein